MNAFAPILHRSGYLQIKSCITHCQFINDQVLELFQVRLKLPLLIASFHLPKIIEVPAQTRTD